jgi:gas vesicle protein
MEDRDDSGLVSLLAGIGVGVLIGGVTALLLAPQSGNQTRTQIRETADDALNRLRDSMDDLKHRVEEVAQNAREVVGRRGQSASPTGALQGDVAGATDEGGAPA